MQTKQSYVDQVASQLIELLEKGVAPWQIPWQPGQAGGMSFNPVSQKRFKGVNALVLYAAEQKGGYLDSRWMTFKQAQSVGAQVRKGEKATTVQYWKFYDERELKDSEGLTIRDSRGEPVIEKILLERPQVFFSAVFNAQQIDGLTEQQKRPVWIDLEQAEQLLAASKANIIHTNNKGAFYRKKNDTITLPNKERFSEVASYYATALHELGHWTGHETRLNRDLSHPFGSVGYAREELRAEISSMMLANDLGIGHDPSNHASYVQSWIKLLKDDPLEIFRAASDAEQIQQHLRKLVSQQEIIEEQSQANVKPQIVRNEFTDLATVTKDNVEVTEQLIAHYKKYDQDRVLLVAEKLHSYREGNTSKAEFTDYTQQKLEVNLTPYFSGVKARLNVPDARLHGEQGSENPNENTATMTSNTETWGVFIRVNDQDQWLKDFDSEKSAHLLRNDLELINALGRSDEYEKNVMLKRIIEDQVQANPQATKDEMNLATHNRDVAEKVAQSHADQLQEQVMLANPRKEENSFKDSEQRTATPEVSRVYLVVPFKEKDEAKSLGAKWDKSAKSWYVQDSPGNRQKVDKWLPKNAVNHVSIHTPQQQFIQFIASMGAIVGGQEIIMDGRKRRIRVAHDKGVEKSGVYLGFLDGIPAGYFKNFRLGESQNWKVDQHELSPEQVKSLMAQAEENRRLRQEAEALAQKESTQALKSLLPFTLAASDAGHDYLTLKNARAGKLRIVDAVASEQLNPLIMIAQDKVQAKELKDEHPDNTVLIKGDLLVPVQDIEGNLRGAQVIRNDAKIYTKNTKKESNFHVVGVDKSGIEALENLKAIVIAEGYATADTVSQAIQMPVVVAFDAGNLSNVAKVLKERFPDKAFVIAGDDDFQLELKNNPNSGKLKAIEAAKIVGGAYVLPIFAPGEQSLLNVVNDFNDLANKSVLGIDAVKRQIMPVVQAQQAKVATLNKIQMKERKSRQQKDANLDVGMRR